MFQLTNWKFCPRIRGSVHLVLVAHPFDVDFFKGILPNELMQCYAQCSLTGGKRAEKLMWQSLLVCDPNFSPYNNDKRSRFRSLATQRKFKTRIRGCHYDRPRLAALCGITNNIEALEKAIQPDNWRIIPFWVASIDYEAFSRIDKTALIMEAYWAWKAGATFQVSPGEIEKLRH